MDLQLADDVAVVVGAASGIGLAIACQFAAEGAHVALLDRNPLVSNEAAVIADHYRVRSLGLGVDVTDLEALGQAAEKVRRELGTHQHLVFAAGAGSGKYGFPFWNLEPRDWEPVLRVNLMGAVNTLQAFTPSLVAQRQGTVLLISSVAGQIGSQTDPPYSAAKAAVLNFTQCAARDLAPHQVRVNAICPGMVKTDLNRSVWQAWRAQQTDESAQDYEAWAEEKIRRVTPLGRWQQPEDVAALAVFLASPRAANITGQALNVDGGQVMR